MERCTNCSLSTLLEDPLPEPHQIGGHVRIPCSKLPLELLGQLAKKRSKHFLELWFGQGVIARLVVDFTQHNQEVREGQEPLIRRTVCGIELTYQALSERLDADHAPQPPFERLPAPYRALKIRAKLRKHAGPTPDAVEEGGLQIVTPERVEVGRGS